MTSVRSGLVLVSGASVAGIVAWLSFLAAGPIGLSWAAVTAVALLALGLRLWLAEPTRRRSPEPEDAQAGPGRFREFEQLVGKVSWATMEDRHFQHALGPTMWRIATAIATDRHGGMPSEDDLRDRFGPDAWRLLDPHRRSDANATAGRRRGPNVVELLQAVERIERL